MRQRAANRAGEAVKILEECGKTVHKVIIDGSRIELILEKSAITYDACEEDNSCAVIDWR